MFSENLNGHLKYIVAIKLNRILNSCVVFKYQPRAAVKRCRATNETLRGQYSNHFIHTPFVIPGFTGGVLIFNIFLTFGHVWETSNKCTCMLHNCNS